MSIRKAPTCYTVVDLHSGAIIRSGDAGSLEGTEHTLLDGESYHVIVGIMFMEYWKFYYNASKQAFIGIPDAPTPHHLWDQDSLTWVDQRELEDFKRLQLAEVNSAYAKASDALTEGYPNAEIATWPNQQRDAEAWQADNSVATPFIDAIAQARGVDRVELLRKTLDNVLRFLSTTARYTGTRQRLRDEIATASTTEEVLAVKWPEFNSTLE